MDTFLIDRMMCSDICPCDITYKPQWQYKFAENELKQRKRTWQSVGLMPITPMTFISPGEVKDKSTSGKISDVKVWNTFDDCF
jgi:hypothetical protein